MEITSWIILILYRRSLFNPETIFMLKVEHSYSRLFVEVKVQKVNLFACSLIESFQLA